MCVLGTITARNTTTTFSLPVGTFVADNDHLLMMSIDAAIVTVLNEWEGVEDGWNGSLTMVAIHKLPLAMRRMAIRIIACDIMQEMSYSAMHLYVSTIEAPLPVVEIH